MSCFGPKRGQKQVFFRVCEYPVFGHLDSQLLAFYCTLKVIILGHLLWPYISHGISYTIRDFMVSIYWVIPFHTLLDTVTRAWQWILHIIHMIYSTHLAITTSVYYIYIYIISLGITHSATPFWIFGVFHGYWVYTYIYTLWCRLLVYYMVYMYDT